MICPLRQSKKSCIAVYMRYLKLRNTVDYSNQTPPIHDITIFRKVLVNNLDGWSTAQTRAARIDEAVETISGLSDTDSGCCCRAPRGAFAVKKPDLSSPRRGLFVQARKKRQAVPSPVNTNRLAKPPRPRTQIPVTSGFGIHPPPIGHQLPPCNRLHAPDQHSPRRPVNFSNKIQTVMHPVNDIDVGKPRRPKHDLAARRPPFARVRCRIILPSVGLNFNDPPGNFSPIAPHHLQNEPHQLFSHRDGVSRKE